MSFIIILFLFRNFELIINSNVVKYNCQAQLWWMSTNEVSNSPLGFDSKEWFFWLINAGERSFWVDSSFTHCNYIKSYLVCILITVEHASVWNKDRKTSLLPGDSDDWIWSDSKYLEFTTFFGTMFCLGKLLIKQES